MDLDTIAAFLEVASSRPSNSWKITNLNSVAGLRVPDFVTGKQDTILRADINALWTQWFLEAMCDPENFVDEYPGYAHIFHAVQLESLSLFANIEDNKRLKLVRQISLLIDREAKRRQKRNRIKFDLSTKEFLWDVYGSNPRCWICGHRFSSWAINKFLKQPADIEAPQPKFLDYLKPRGLNKRDFQIEIDHVFPLASGGDEDVENLRFACGWCNAHKSNRLSVYDVAAKPPVIRHPKLGRVSVPNPFWVVRLLSLKGQCENSGGCSNTTDNAELTVVSRHKQGSMNPINLQVVCLDHDHLGPDRFISYSSAQSIFRSAR